MKKELPRVLALMIDQLAGHWVNGVIIQATGFPPPNVEDYHQLGLIPNISDCIRNGLWVRHGWNRGICATPYVSQYIVYGTYSKKREEHIISAIKTKFPTTKTASFSNWDWDVYDPEHNIGPENFDFNFSKYTLLKEELKARFPELSAEELERAYWNERAKRKKLKIKGLSDYDLLNQYAIPWMKENRDWKIIYMHWLDHDNTICPAFVENPKGPFDDKHHHLTNYVDKNVGELIKFLKSEGWWEKMYLILFSDHGYHLNCNAPESQKYGRDFCSNHQSPHDCFVWDYEKRKATTVHSNGCRRIFIILSGGALSVELRGRQVQEGEIIDVPATIADIYGIPYDGDGMSILSRV